MYVSLRMARLGQVKLLLWMDHMKEKVKVSFMNLNLKAEYYRELLCSFLLRLSV